MFRMFSSQPATPGMSAAEAIQKSAAGEIVVLDIRDGPEAARPKVRCMCRWLCCG